MLGIVCFLLVVLSVVVVISAGTRTFKNRKSMTYDILCACYRRTLFSFSLITVSGIAIGYLSGDSREMYGAVIRIFPVLVINIIVTRRWLKKLKKADKESE